MSMSSNELCTTALIPGCRLMARSIAIAIRCRSTPQEVTRFGIRGTTLRAVRRISNASSLRCPAIFTAPVKMVCIYICMKIRNSIGTLMTEPV